MEADKPDICLLFLLTSIPCQNILLNNKEKVILDFGRCRGSTSGTSKAASSVGRPKEIVIPDYSLFLKLPRNTSIRTDSPKRLVSQKHI